MKDVDNIFGNVFDDPGISQLKLIAFSTDVVQRLSANNPDHLLDGQIGALSSALATMVQQSTADRAMLGIRKGAKFTKNEFRESIRDEIRQIYAVALAAFNEPSEEMNNIFPKGRSIFNHSRDDELIEHLDVMISGLTLHEADLGGEVVADATALRDQWLDIYDASENATGVKTATESERREARRTLVIELYRTAGLLITIFPEAPERYTLYMQQHLLGGPSSDTPPPIGGGNGDTGSGSGSTIGSSSGSTSMGSSTSSFSTVTSGSSASTSSSASMAPSSSSIGSSNSSGSSAS